MDKENWVMENSLHVSCVICKGLKIGNREIKKAVGISIWKRDGKSVVEE